MLNAFYYIEAITELDFFSKIHEDDQEELESKVITEDWKQYINNQWAQWNPKTLKPWFPDSEKDSWAE